MALPQEEEGDGDPRMAWWYQTKKKKVRRAFLACYYFLGEVSRDLDNKGDSPVSCGLLQTAIWIAIPFLDCFSAAILILVIRRQCRS